MLDYVDAQPMNMAGLAGHDPAVRSIRNYGAFQNSERSAGL
jgi:hypothetical protein